MQLFELKTFYLIEIIHINGSFLPSHFLYLSYLQSSPEHSPDTSVCLKRCLFPDTTDRILTHCTALSSPLSR